MFAMCVLVLACIVGMNCTVDVSGTFHATRRAEFALKYVRVLLSSRDGLVFSPYERAVKLALLRATQSDCYVTGSSHEMQLRLENFSPARTAGCRQLVNIAISGASFEDLVTQIGEMLEQPGLRAVFVGIGPWMLRRGADQRWTEERAVLLGDCVQLGIHASQFSITPKDRLKLVYSAINWEYLGRNLHALVREKAPFVPADERTADDAVMLPDGALRYSAQFLADKPPPPQLVGDGSYKIAKPYADPTVLHDLFAAGSMLERRGVQVTFLFMPYHPKVMGCSNAAVCEAMRAVEHAMSRLGAQIGAQLIGSYDPAASGLEWRDFFDDMHVSTQALGELRWPIRTPKEARL